MAAAPGTGITARQVAAKVVTRVLKEGAYLSRALDAELLRHPGLDARDRSLATELSYGSVRTYGYLRECLERHATRKLRAKDQELMAELLVAAYQILLLDRVPASAAINAAVGEVKRKRGPQVAGFANALLRNLGRAEARADREQAVLASLPDWLVERMRRDFGERELLELVGAGGAAPPVVARLAPGKPLPPAWAAARPCRFAPRAFELPEALPKSRRSESTFVVQEEGSQLVAWALGARPGETVLDACAGRGGKTSLVWESMGQSGTLWAADAHPDKLERLTDDFGRLGLSPPTLAAVDWTVGQGLVPAIFQRALVDAPCTGSGTLRRRPEIALRLAAGDAERMSHLQRAIVRSVATRLVPGGRLVYAVCSVFQEEAEAVVASLSDILEPVPFDSPVLERAAPGMPTSFRLLPGTHGTDGYFLASLRLR